MAHKLHLRLYVSDATHHSSHVTEQPNICLCGESASQIFNKSQLLKEFFLGQNVIFLDTSAAIMFLEKGRILHLELWFLSNIR